MTRELCHELYKHWTNDASIYMDMHLFQPYVYDEAAVNRYFDMKGQDASRRLFAIMLGYKAIGELQLKQIDHDKKRMFPEYPYAKRRGEGKRIWNAGRTFGSKNRL